MEETMLDLLEQFTDGLKDDIPAALVDAPKASPTGFAKPVAKENTLIGRNRCGRRSSCKSQNRRLHERWEGQRVKVERRAQCGHSLCELRSVSDDKNLARKMQSKTVASSLVDFHT